MYKFNGNKMKKTCFLYVVIIVWNEYWLWWLYANQQVNVYSMYNYNVVITQVYDIQYVYKYYIHVGVSDTGYMCYIVTTLVKGLISMFVFLTAPDYML